MGPWTRILAYTRLTEVIGSRLSRIGDLEQAPMQIAGCWVCPTCAERLLGDFVISFIASYAPGPMLGGVLGRLQERSSPAELMKQFQTHLATYQKAREGTIVLS